MLLPWMDGRRDTTSPASGFWVVNEIEASALAGTDAVSGDWSGVVAALARRAPEAAIALTLGSAGLVYSDRRSGLVRLPAHAVTVVDETAAGDAFVGFLIGSLIRGEKMGRGGSDGVGCRSVGGHAGRCREFRSPPWPTYGRWRMRARP